MKAYCELFRKQLNKKAPRLLNMLRELNLTTDTFAFDWLFTLYSRAFDLPVVKVLWDIILCLGDFYAIKAGVVLLSQLESTFMEQVDKTSFVRLAVRGSSIGSIVKLLLENELVSQQKYEKKIEKCLRELLVKEYEQKMAANKRNLH